MTSRYWSHMEEFHERAHTDHPNGAEGMAAFRYFRSILEPNWVDADSNKHPFHHWITFASTHHYDRLILLRRRFELVQDTVGFRSRAKRLAHRTEYLSAMTEIETGVKLRLQGIQITFPREKSGDTPDIIADIGGQRYWVEVTSVNPPALETSFMNLLGGLMGTSMKLKVTVGGFAIAHFTEKDIRAIESDVEHAANEIAGKDGVRKVVVPGKAIFYVGSGTGVSDIPEKWRGGFQAWRSRDRPASERIIAKICDKGKKNYLEGGPGFLVLYDWMVPHEEVDKILENPEDDLGLVMAVHPQILGMTLVVPSESAPRMYPAVIVSSKTRESRIHALPDMTTERVVLWRNVHATAELPSMITSAFLEYPSALSRNVDLD